MTANHASMMGPKMRPMKPVPRLCTRNSATSTATVIGTTARDSPGASTLSPSIADRTEMAGVMAPSP